MFRKLIKNKKAQNTAEYAILISLVVAGIIAMQTYAQRALQARVRDASLYLQEQTEMGDVESQTQYEPYYLQSEYNIDRTDSTSRAIEGITDETKTDSNRVRESGGYQVSTYDTSIMSNGF